MGGATMLPTSLRSPRAGAVSAASASRACASVGAAAASRARLNRACFARPTTATAAAANGSKRPGSSREDEPPTKRRRAGGDSAAKNPPMSLAEKDGVQQLLLSLGSLQVNPLPDLVVRCLQENGVRCYGGGGGDEAEIEIDVHSLGDEALRKIRYRVGAYLDGITRRDAAWSQRQSKDGEIGQSAPRSIPSKSIPSQAASGSILSKAASKNIQPRAASKSISSQAALKSIPPRAMVNNHRPRPAPTSTPRKAPSTSTMPKAALKTVPPKAEPLLPAPPSQSQSTLRGSPPSASSLLPAPSQPMKPMKELLADSRKAMQEVLRRRELEQLRAAAASKNIPVKAATSQSSLRSSQPGSSTPTKSDAGETMQELLRRRELDQLRAAARRELEKMVRTVEFNDPYIDVQDAFK